MSNALMKVNHVSKVYQSKDFKGVKNQTVALNDVSLTLYEGETLGLVGESGSGKSTLGKVILGFEKLTSGRIEKTRETIKKQIIFQDPYSSLNPKMSALESVLEPLKDEKDQHAAREKAIKVLEIVGIKGDDVHKIPRHFSGGQRQRIGIARAVVSNPDFIVCDEPTSALDVSIQAQIIDLLKNLQEEYNLSYLFISHDLSVVKHISDRIAVMYKGNVVELATTQQLFDNPQHPYTKKLLGAALSLDPLKAREQLQSAPLMETFDMATGELVEVEPGHFVRR